MSHLCSEHSAECLLALVEFTQFKQWLFDLILEYYKREKANITNAKQSHKLHQFDQEIIQTVNKIEKLLNIERVDTEDIQNEISPQQLQFRGPSTPTISNNNIITTTTTTTATKQASAALEPETPSITGNIRVISVSSVDTPNNTKSNQFIQFTPQTSNQMDTNTNTISSNETTPKFTTASTFDSVVGAIPPQQGSITPIASIASVSASSVAVVAPNKALNHAMEESTNLDNVVTTVANQKYSNQASPRLTPLNERDAIASETEQNEFVEAKQTPLSFAASSSTDNETSNDKHERDHLPRGTGGDDHDHDHDEIDATKISPPGAASLVPPPPSLQIAGSLSLSASASSLSGAGANASGGIIQGSTLSLPGLMKQKSRKKSKLSKITIIRFCNEIPKSSIVFAEVNSSTIADLTDLRLIEAVPGTTVTPHVRGHIIKQKTVDYMAAARKKSRATHESLAMQEYELTKEEIILDAKKKAYALYYKYMYVIYIYIVYIFFVCNFLLGLLKL